MGYKWIQYEDQEDMNALRNIIFQKVVDTLNRTNNISIIKLLIILFYWKVLYKYIK